MKKCLLFNPEKILAKIRRPLLFTRKM